MFREKPAVAINSINMDLVSTVRGISDAGETVLGKDFQIHQGGKGMNQAVSVARFGHLVRLTGGLGDDAFGGRLRTHLEETGVHTEGVLTSDETSGISVILVSATGENSLVLSPGANGNDLGNLESSEVASANNGALSVDLNRRGHRLFRLDPKDRKLTEEMTS